MINPIELRIGNLLINSDSRIVRVTGLPLGKSHSEWQIEADYSDYDFPYLNPIEITEEWLIRAGFIKKWLDNGSTIRCWDYEFNEFHIHGMGDDLFTFMTRKINYIHQLQNLYMCLTGNELEISK